MARGELEEWREGSCGRDTAYEGRICFQGRKGKKEERERGKEGESKGGKAGWRREEGKKEIKYTGNNETLDFEVLWLLWAHLLSDTWPKLHLP